ncbi:MULTISPECIES: ABC transporter permease [Synechocystis]|uniref:ABC transporter permease n=1 Tax=Synechocystis salina LEGE 00031 TaxID=1828736 RepID=A0ABR9VP98_9SYNC|nr:MULTISPECIES: ABC transporter permease [Synechocystis]MBE9194155.1 ABC transporter permease [Synechocystis sp. LEGE 06083]MBE9239950.1 ABC transporter permease [Synechocystis salina LEGE 00041]MBE9253167.1 ABC transporter permease [Synechocystis salina LEGE 00031]QUS62114.1 ABC transporter permease [Synechocystis sp. PCC 7338]UAJ71311.1 ABC transporter permease [Synechocystis sp. PCC 7339]
MTIAQDKLPNYSPKKSLQPTVFWRIGGEIPESLKWSLMSLSIIIPLVLWALLSSLPTVSDVFLPSPQSVVQALIELFNDGFLIQDSLTSFGRVVGGFFLGGLVAIPLGILMGTFPSIRSLTEPIIGVVRYMPAPAFIPLLIIYLGIDEASKIALIFIGTIFFNTLMIMDAVKFIPKELIEVTYTLGGLRKQVLFKVITPYIIPNILDAFRINMAAAWNLVVVAELVAADNGLGKRILLAQKFLKTDEIFACLIVLGLIGFALDLSFRLILRLTCKWSLEQ